MQYNPQNIGKGRVGSLWEPIAVELFNDVDNFSFYDWPTGTSATAFSVSNNIMTTTTGSSAVIAICKNSSMMDGKLQMVFENPDTSHSSTSYVGLAFRIKDKMNFLLVTVRENDNKCSLYDVVNGVATEIANVSIPNDALLVTGVPTSLELSVIGNMVKVWVNGHLVATWVNSEITKYKYGKCGIVARQNYSHQISNFCLQKRVFLEIPKSIKKIVGIGSSIMAGEASTLPWFTKFIAMLNQNNAMGLVGINKGIGGNDTNQMLVRFNNDVLNNSPDVVIIETSVNDLRLDKGISLDTSVSNITSMVRSAKVAGVIPVLIGCTPIDPTITGIIHDITTVREVPKLNALARMIATQEEIRFIDVFDAFSNDMQYINSITPPRGTADGVHPIDVGTDLIALTAYNVFSGFNYLY